MGGKGTIITTNTGQGGTLRVEVPDPDGPGVVGGVLPYSSGDFDPTIGQLYDISIPASGPVALNALLAPPQGVVVEGPYYTMIRITDPGDSLATLNDIYPVTIWNNGFPTFSSAKWPAGTSIELLSFDTLYYSVDRDSGSPKHLD